MTNLIVQVVVSVLVFALCATALKGCLASGIFRTPRSELSRNCSRPRDHSPEAESSPSRLAASAWSYRITAAKAKTSRA